MKTFKIGLACALLLVAVSSLTALSSSEPKSVFDTSNDSVMSAASSSEISFTPRRGTRQLLRRVKSIQSVGAAPVNTSVFDTPDNSVMNVRMRVVAIDLATGRARSVETKASYKRYLGVLSRLGNKVVTVYDKGDPGTNAWQAEIEFDDATDTISIIVTGEAGEIVDWMADFEIDMYQP